jgi:hypothetical protein
MKFHARKIRSVAVITLLSITATAAAQINDADQGTNAEDKQLL